MPDIKRIIDQLKNELADNSLVVGFVLVGSYARDNVYIADQYSDLEAYIITKDGKEVNFEKQIPTLVKNLGKIFFSYKNQWAGYSSVFDDLFRLELPVISKSSISQVFSRPTAQVVKIIFDKTEGELEKVLGERPKSVDFGNLFQNRVTDFWYMLILAVQYFKKGEIWNARSALQILQSSLIKLFELLQDPDILLLESNKRVEQFLSEEQQNLLKQVSPAYNKKQIKDALINIIEIFSEVSKQVSQKYNYDYDKNIEQQAKPKLLSLLSE